MCRPVIPVSRMSGSASPLMSSSVERPLMRSTPAGSAPMSTTYGPSQPAHDAPSSEREYPNVKRTGVGASPRPRCSTPASRLTPPEVAAGSYVSR